MAKVPKREGVKTDGRFVDNGDGTVTDRNTGLMWAAKDNGSDINWSDAKRYCENYRGGGYDNWRMPTEDELTGLYDPSMGYIPSCAPSGDTDKVYLTNLITLSCRAVWVSETSGSNAVYVGFYGGTRYLDSPSESGTLRALPVRNTK